MLAVVSDNKSESPESLSAKVLGVGCRQDKANFTELFSYYVPRITSFAMKRGFSREIAEEIAQDVMRTLWEKAATYDPSVASANTWVFTIARNQCVDRARRTKRRNEKLDAYALEPLIGVAFEPNIDAIRAEKRIQAALADLPQDQLEMLKRAFFEGKSHQVIAREAGLPLGTVKSRIRLALRRLRESLVEELGPEASYNKSNAV